MHITRSFQSQAIELCDAAFGSEPDGERHPLSRLYNRHLGPLTALRIHRPELSDFSMYTASCEHSLMSALMADIAVRSPALDTMLIPGGGKGRGMSQPLLSALGEGSERLLAVLHFQGVADTLEFATREQLERAGAGALGPERLPLFAEEQYAEPAFRFRPFRDDTPICWHPATDLLSGEPVGSPRNWRCSTTSRATANRRSATRPAGALALRRAAAARSCTAFTNSWSAMRSMCAGSAASLPRKSTWISRRSQRGCGLSSTGALPRKR